MPTTPTRQPDIYRRAAERKLGRPLTPSEVVHHNEEDLALNTASDTTVMTRAQHTALHGRKRPLGKLRSALRMVKEGRKLYGLTLLAAASLTWSCSLPAAPDGVSSQCAAYNTGVVQIRNLTNQPLKVNFQADYLQQVLAPGKSLLEPLTMKAEPQPFTFWAADGSLYGSAGILPVQCASITYDIR